MFTSLKSLFALTIAVTTFTTLAHAQTVGVLPRSPDPTIGFNSLNVNQAPVRTHAPFFGTFNDRFPHFGSTFSPRTINGFGHDFLDFDGSIRTIDRDLDGIPDIRDNVISFENPGFVDPFENLTPNEIEARGDFIRDQGTAAARRSLGVGTGVGNKYAGLGAYNYGTAAGQGLLYSGMGDYYAGQGQFLRGAGDYAHSKSIANVNNEEAEYRDIRNDSYYTQTFFEKRRTNLEARAREKELRRYVYGDRPSAAQLAHYQKLREPDRLDAQEYEPVLGHLNWPAVLEGEEFEEIREFVDQRFAARSNLGNTTGLGSDNYKDIREATAALKVRLLQNMDDMTPMEYVAAKNFVESLEREALEEVDLTLPGAMRTASFRK